jgi:hypothetical protein
MRIAKLRSISSICRPCRTSRWLGMKSQLKSFIMTVVLACSAVAVPLTYGAPAGGATGGGAASGGTASGGAAAGGAASAGTSSTGGQGTTAPVASHGTTSTAPSGTSAPGAAAPGTVHQGWGPGINPNAATNSGAGTIVNNSALMNHPVNSNASGGGGLESK